MTLGIDSALRFVLSKNPGDLNSDEARNTLRQGCYTSGPNETPGKRSSSGSLRSTQLTCLENPGHRFGRSEGKWYPGSNVSTLSMGAFPTIDYRYSPRNVCSTTHCTLTRQNRKSWSYLGPLQSLPREVRIHCVRFPPRSGGIGLYITCPSATKKIRFCLIGDVLNVNLPVRLFGPHVSAWRGLNREVGTDGKSYEIAPNYSERYSQRTVRYTEIMASSVVTTYARVEPHYSRP